MRRREGVRGLRVAGGSSQGVTARVAGGERVLGWPEGLLGEGVSQSGKGA